MISTLFRTTAAVALLAAAGSASAERLFGLTLDNRIVTFNSANPETTLSDRTISGLAAGDTLLGIDFRPATGSLFSLGSSGQIYELMPMGSQYVATMKGMLSIPQSGTSFGIDFNPVPDRMRLVSDTGQNLRINVDGGATIMDGNITSTTGPVMLLGAAYTNSVPGAMTTTLYGIDAVGDTLLRSTNANAGTYTDTNMMGATFAPLGLNFTTDNNVGFDISANDMMAYLSIDSLLWQVSLTTGEASSLGIVGAGTLRGLTAAPFSPAVPEPATWAMMIAGFGLVGAVMRRRQSIPQTAA